MANAPVGAPPIMEYVYCSASVALKPSVATLVPDVAFSAILPADVHANVGSVGVVGGVVPPSVVVPSLPVVPPLLMTEGGGVVSAVFVAVVVPVFVFRF